MVGASIIRDLLSSSYGTIIGERSEPLSRVFNDQPRDIYMAMSPYVRTYVSNAHAHVCMSV